MNLSPSQQLLVEDGLPMAALVPAEERKAAWKGRKLTVPKATVGKQDEDPTTVAFKAELERKARLEAKTKKAQRKEALAIKRRQMAHITAAKAAATHEGTDTMSKKATAKKTAKTTRKAAPVKAKASRATTASAKNNARTAAAGPGKDVRAGSKLEIVVGLLKRPGGCTAAEILEACAWPSVSVPQQARSAGLTLKKEKVDGVTRYSAE